MNADEIIEEIKRLSPAEQMHLIRLIYDLLKDRSASPRYMDDETFRRAMDEVFRKYGDVLRRLAD